MTRADEPEKRPEPKRPEPKRPEPKLPEPKPPRHSARTIAEKAARERRLAEEMRNNLKKRKARARAQAERGKPD